MTRLTDYDGTTEHAHYTACFDEATECVPACDGCEHLIAACDKLAAYEDTGLTPEQVAELIVAYRWVPVTECLPQSGQTVLAGWIETIGDETYSQHALVDYYRAGDEVADEAPWRDAFDRADGSKEEKLLHALFHAQKRTIEQDGLYLYDVGSNGLCKHRRHADIITHWMALPQVPEEEEI